MHHEGKMKTTSDDLLAFAANLLATAGFTRPVADEMADLLVWANLRGIDSHGVLRIPRYVEMLELGLLKAKFEMIESDRSGPISVLDADKAPGAVAMNLAVETASHMADTNGLGWCSVRNTSHAGAIGYFVQKLAHQGKIGIAMTASKPLMSYYGAKGEALSSNPLAIAVPQQVGKPAIILDMSTASVALGKIMAAKDANRDIPLGWAIDAEGAETTDPHKVAALLPMAGAKGSGLSLMIEILCSLLVGNANIAPSLSGHKSGGFNGMVLAIDPGAFGDRDLFLEQVGELAAAIHGLEPAAGVDQVLLPGERGHVTEALRRRQGIPLAKGTQEKLKSLAARLEVPLPTGWN